VDRITYNSAISALGRSGQWQEALLLFREMQESGLPELQPCATTHNAVISACARGGEAALALAAFDAMAPRGLKKDKVSAVVVLAEHFASGCCCMCCQ
jgi:pentatricopeptide repeat protein